jgi:PAS domain S-box-containing protein
MIPHLRVLLVEDSEDDAQLLLSELRHGGFDPVPTRVDTAAGLAGALDAQEWDVVLSDYLMPRFDGLAALKLVRERELDVPFILVSGVIGEEFAVTAMKSGAHDYISKSNLSRLVPAVERELREAGVRRQRRQAGEEVKRLLSVVQAEKQKLLSLLNSISDEVWFADTNRKFTLANRSAVREFNLDSRDNIDVEQLAASLEVYRADGSARPIGEAPPLRALAGEILRAEDEIIRTPGTGELRYRQVSAAPVSDDKGHVIGSVTVVRDVTGQKLAEQALCRAEERARLALHAGRMAIWDRTLPDGQVLWNAEHYRMLGYAPGSVTPGYQAWADRVHPDDRAEAEARFQDSLTGDGRLTFEFRVVWPEDGSIHWIEARCRTERDTDGRPTRTYGVMIDVSDRKRLELVTARLASIVESSRDAIIGTDLSGIVTSWNAGAENLFGYTAPEMTGQPMLRLIPAILQEEETDILDRIKRGEPGWHFETLRMRKDGSPVDVSATVSPIKDSAGKIIGASKVVRDITGRKREQEALRESEERFRAMANAMPQLAWTARADGHIFWYNQRWYEYTGTTPEQMEGWGWQSVHDETELPGVLERWKHSIATANPFEMVFPLRGADGAFRLFLTRVIPLKDAAGHVTQWFGTNTDVSELKRTQEALRENRERLRLFIEHAPAGIAMFDREMRYLFASNRWKLDYGLREDPTGRSHYELFPEISEHWKEMHRRALAGEILSADEDLFQRADGTAQWVKWEALPWHTADGQVGGILIAAEEITSAVRAKEALRESEERHRLVVETMLQGVVHQDADGRIIGMNPAAERILGKSREQFLGSDSVREEHDSIRENGEPFPGLEHPSMVALRTGQPQRGVIMGVFNPKLGARRWISIDAVPVRHPSGTRPMEVYTVFEDITERRIKEEQLLKLNRILAARTRSSQAMMRACNETDYLNEVCRIVEQDCGHALVWVGYAENDEARSVRPVVSAGFEEGYLEAMNITWADTERGRGPTGSAIRTGQPCQCRDMQWDRRFAPWSEEALKRGFASSLALPLRDRDAVFGALTIYSREPAAFSEDEVELLAKLADDLAYGITVLLGRAAQEVAEAALRENEARFRGIFHDAATAMAVTLPDGRYLEVNCAYCEMFGYSEQELRATTFADITYPEDRHATAIDAPRRLASREIATYRVEKRYVHKRGHVVWGDLNVAVVPNPDGSVAYFIAQIQDITARKQAEEALRESEERYRSLFNTMIEGFCIIELIFDAGGSPVDYRFLEINPAFETQTGLRNARGRLMRELAPDLEAHWFDIYGHIAMTGEPLTFMHEARALNRWFQVSAFRVGGAESRRVAVLFNDITESKRATDALRESERREKARAAELAALLDAVPAPVFIAHDPECLHLTGNCAANELLRIPRGAETSLSAPEEVRPRHFRAFKDGRELRLDELPAQRAARGEHVSDFEFTLAFDDGGTRQLLGYGTPLLDDAGRPRGAVHVLVDITARKQGEEALRGSEQLARSQWAEAEAALESVPANIAILDASGVIMRVNREWISFGNENGVALGSVAVGANYLAICGAVTGAEAAQARRFAAGIRSVISGKEKRFSMEYPCHSPQKERWFMGYVTASPGGGPARVVVAHVDITGQKVIEEQIRRLNEELESRVIERTSELRAAVNALEEQIAERQRLEREVLSISEREQARVGQDLHDGICQNLAGIAFLAEVLRSNLAGKKSTMAAASRDAETIANLTRETIEETHNLATGLFPVRIEKNGLMSALNELAVDTTRRFHIKCRFKCDKPVLIADNHAATHLYRIAQEAVSNAVKHGRAGSVAVKLGATAGRIILKIEDNGDGLLKKMKRSGMGMRTMDYRARSMEGLLEIRQRKPRGLAVICSIPIQQGKNHE